MTPFHVDQGMPDGVRDRFQWSRFGTPLWLTVGALLLLVVALGSSQAPDSRARGDAMRAAFGVTLEARAAAERAEGVAEQPTLLPSPARGSSPP